MTSGERKIPIKKGLWVGDSSGQSRLLGSRCVCCGELFFPPRTNGRCVRCQESKAENVELSQVGTITSFSTVTQSPAGGFYHGTVPYSYGLVDLDDGVRLKALLGGQSEQLKVGTRVKLVIETLYQDQDGNQVQVFRFRPLE